MDTAVTSLSYGDLFLVETSELGTGIISAGDINYVSYQFPKKFNTLKSGRIFVPILSSVGPLSGNNIRLLNTQTASSSLQQYNTYAIQGGLVTAASNTYTTEVASLSTTVNTKINQLSAAVFHVFTDSGSARLTQFKHAYGIGVNEITITGTKNVPTGLKIYSYDIQLKAFFNGYIPGTLVQVTSASPLVWLKDFDYNFTNYIATGEDDFGDNYVVANKVQFNVDIANVANNDANPLGSRQTLLTWNVTKFYYLSSNGIAIDWNDYINPGRV